MLTQLLLSLSPFSLAPLGDVLLPEGPAARAWASVDPSSPIRDEWMDELKEGTRDALRAQDPWQTPAAWEAWSDWISAERRGAVESAGLAILAASGGRDEDAWGHYAALVSDPVIAAAVMPRLLPGIPAELSASEPLPDGCLLRPTPPPGALAAARGRTRPVTASTELEVGEAKLRLVISIEPSGVEVALHHLSGGPVTLQVQLPELLEREVRVSYIDWMRQDERNAPLSATLTPDMEGPVQLFGRFLARSRALPASPSSTLPKQLLAAGLWIEPEGRDELTPIHSAAAAALSSALGVPGGARRAKKDAVPLLSAGLVIHLPEGPQGARTLSRIVRAAEAWLLSKD